MLCSICGSEMTTGGCPKCSQAYSYTISTVFSKHPFTCPVCSGAGKVSRPPHIAGDVSSWSDNQTGPYLCQACQGTGVVWGPPD